MKKIKSTIEVEYLRAFDDNTWDTVTVKVPTNEEDPADGVDFKEVNDSLTNELQDYANRVLMTLPENRKVVLMAVYTFNTSATVSDDV